MYFLLALFKLAFSDDIPYLNELTFDTRVVHRKKNDVWVILFYEPNNAEKNGDILSKFSLSSRKSMDIKFGIVNATKQKAIIKGEKIETFPTIKMYNNKKNITYTGKIETRDIIKKAFSMVPNLVQDISLSWKDCTGTPTIILFNQSNKIPVMWRSVASYYSGKNVRVGYCKDPNYFFPFGVSVAPSILFSNSTQFKRYHGRFSYRDVIQTVDNYFFSTSGNAQDSTENDQSQSIPSYGSPKNFDDICIGSHKYCVVVKAAKPTAEIETLRKTFSKSHLNWILGKSDFPFDFMNKNEGAWIYNPRKDAFVSTKISDLQITLEHVLNGEGKWTNRQKMDEL